MHLMHLLGPTLGKLLIIVVSISGLSWGWSAHRASSRPLIMIDEPPLFFSDQMKDDLGALLKRSLKNARESVYLEIFTLSDHHIVKILNELSNKGVRIHICADDQSNSVISKLDSRITYEVLPSSGLMHRKIAVIDSKIIWLGSANITDESLNLHHNFLIAFQSPEIASFLKQEETPSQQQFAVAGQPLEIWMLPEYRAAQKRVIESLDQAVHSIKIAMFSWTSSELAEAVLRAKARGVDVQIVLDRQGAQQASASVAQKLIQGGIKMRLSLGLPLLHYKFAWIDDQELLMGSANWTAGGFGKNREFVTRFPILTFDQENWMAKLWARCWVESSVPLAK